MWLPRIVIDSAYGRVVRSSGLIVAFVVALWAAYFVPLVLRRYDESSKNSALDEQGPLRRVVADASARPDRPAAKATAMSTSPAPVARRTAARIAAERRRRTLLTLIGLLAVVAAVAVAGLLPVWAITVPVLLIVAWLVACRVQVRGERGLSQRHSVLSRIPVPSFGHHGSAKESSAKDGTAGPRPAARTKTAKPRPERRADEEDTVIVAVDAPVDGDAQHAHVMESAPLDDSELGEQLQIAVPSVSVTGEALWDPLPVTVPTYVSKPRVGRTVRTIDFGAGGAWTSGHVEAEQNVDYPGGQAAAGSDGEERRAVGH